MSGANELDDLEMKNLQKRVDINVSDTLTVSLGNHACRSLVREINGRLCSESRIEINSHFLDSPGTFHLKITPHLTLSM
jgi:hypothetical protein